MTECNSWFSRWGCKNDATIRLPDRDDGPGMTCPCSICLTCRYRTLKRLPFNPWSRDTDDEFLEAVAEYATTDECIEFMAERSNKKRRLWEFMGIKV